MVFDVLTLFPGMFEGPLQEGVLVRARRSGLIGVRVHDLRRFGVGRHRQVDDQPYGGGGGMVLKPEPLFEAVEHVRRRYPVDGDKVLLMSPQGRRLSHDVAGELAKLDRVILLSGRYEGVDDRVRKGLADEELSIGDYILTGGELPALVVIDAVSRFVPGVLGNDEGAKEDSFEEGMLEYPQFTRPAEYRGMRVPEVLLSGDHGAIREWRREQAEQNTRDKRPDLLGGKKQG